MRFVISQTWRAGVFSGWRLVVMLSSLGEKFCSWCSFAGIYGLSNKILDDPSAKLVHGKQKFTDALLSHTDSKERLIEELMEIMSDETWWVLQSCARHLLFVIVIVAYQCCAWWWGMQRQTSSCQYLPGWMINLCTNYTQWHHYWIAVTCWFIWGSPEFQSTSWW